LVALSTLRAMDAVSLRASIGLYAGRTLEMAAVGDGFQLRSGSDVVATLTAPVGHDRGEIASLEGRWWVENPRGAELDVGRLGYEGVVARYRPRLTGGGVIRVDEIGRFSLRPPGLGDTAKLRRRLGAGLRHHQEDGHEDQQPGHDAHDPGVLRAPLVVVGEH
jgi:hypothetical protein